MKIVNCIVAAILIVYMTCARCEEEHVQEMKDVWSTFANLTTELEITKSKLSSKRHIAKWRFFKYFNTSQTICDQTIDNFFQNCTDKMRDFHKTVEGKAEKVLYMLNSYSVANQTEHRQLRNQSFKSTKVNESNSDTFELTMGMPPTDTTKEIYNQFLTLKSGVEQLKIEINRFIEGVPKSVRVVFDRTRNCYKEYASRPAHTTSRCEAEVVPKMKDAWSTFVNLTTELEDTKSKLSSRQHIAKRRFFKYFNTSIITCDQTINNFVKNCTDKIKDFQETLERKTKEVQEMLNSYSVANQTEHRQLRSQSFKSANVSQDNSNALELTTKVPPITTEMICNDFQTWKPQVEQLKIEINRFIEGVEKSGPEVFNRTRNCYEEYEPPPANTTVSISKAD